MRLENINVYLVANFKAVEYIIGVRTLSEFELTFLLIWFA